MELCELFRHFDLKLARKIKSGPCMNAPKYPALAVRSEKIRRGTIGAFATFHSTRTKTPRPVRPKTRGARTLADFQDESFRCREAAEH